MEPKGLAVACDQKWIKVQDDMPKEHESIWNRFYGTDKWHGAMFRKLSNEVNVYVLYEDGSGKVTHSYTADGKWRLPNGGTVTHWMPLPKPPKEENQ